MKKRRIYLDYASTTPLDSRVFKAMQPYLKEDFGNPSALYKEGVTTKQAIGDARKKIADILNVRSEEVYFTGSGTESNNSIVQGVGRAHSKPHIITTNIEHPSILEVCKNIEANGGEVTYVPVEENGIVDPQKIKAALKSNTVLVSVMYANNEIGTIQPLRDISRAIKASGFSPYFHTDASQAANYLDLSFQKLGVDAMTLDASKFYGPKGIGILAMKRSVEVKPLIFGGGQEKGIRSGTENVPAIVGCAEALSIAQKIKDKELARLKKLQHYFFSAVIKKIPNVYINGDTELRLPNNLNICIPGIDAEFAVIKLDHAGIACSAASACLNLSENSYSYVVEALGKHGIVCRESSLRFTMGRGTTLKDIKTLLAHSSLILGHK